MGFFRRSKSARKQPAATVQQVVPAVPAVINPNVNPNSAYGQFLAREAERARIKREIEDQRRQARGARREKNRQQRRTEVRSAKRARLAAARKVRQPDPVKLGMMPGGDSFRRVVGADGKSHVIHIQSGAVLKPSLAQRLFDE